ncbi:hypothetical protein SK128_022286 [Halocaridina rubra]|uniref:Vacuolar protein sorting-associated protein 13 VPS13 adaptor binding domain-containing protein n=1 Tax=Halocaridina rubra TaxID=373956 RepID=A0AAN8XUJ8_HALRR
MNLQTLADGNAEFEIIASSKYQEPDSIPSSPVSAKSRSRDGSASEDDSCADGIGDWDHLSLNSSFGVSSQVLIRDDTTLEPNFHQFCPNPVTLYQEICKFRVQINVPGFDELTVFVGNRSRSRVFQLSPPQNDHRYHIIVTVEVEHETTRVIVRSPLQVLNDLPLPVNVCFKKSIIEMLGTSLGELQARVVSPVNPFEAHVPMITLQPDQVFTIPLTVAYHSSLHIQPAAADYGISEIGVWWKEVLNSTRSHLLVCKSKVHNEQDITAAVTMREGIKLSSAQWEGLGGVLPNYTLCFSPPLAIHNHLPCTLMLTHPALTQPLTLDPGAQTMLYKVNLNEKVYLEVQVCNYLGSDWDGTLEIGAERGDDHRILTLSHGDGDARRKLELTLYTVREGSTSVYVYSPYWIVNKTGLPLHIRGARSKNVYDLNGPEEIILFRYKRNYPHKLKIRVVESDWSRRWSCEAVGSCGVVVCTDKTRDKKYRLLARVKQSTLFAQSKSEGNSSGKIHLTKIVTLMPYFLVRNLTTRPLKFMQENDRIELWYDIHPQQCIPFWPDSEDMHMVVRYQNQQIRSQHFHFNSIHTTVLRMEKGRALSVNVNGVGSDNPVVITFDKYQVGDAPVRIENWCEDVHLRIHQRGSNQTHLLAPYQSQLYTWDDPTLPRELLWNIYNRKSDDIAAVINMDDHGSKYVMITSLKPSMVRAKSQSSMGTPKTRPKKIGQRHRAKTVASSSSTDSEEDIDERGSSQLLMPNQPNKTRKEKILVYWVSYKQGGQRILLFTQSDRMAASARLPMERATLELCLAMEKIGLSLVSLISFLCQRKAD